MDQQRWEVFVDIAAVVWIVLFAVDMAHQYGELALSSGAKTALTAALQLLLFVFLLDLFLLYRWSEQDLRPFVRDNLFWILTVVPWFRPLRLLRVGRGIRALRLLAGSRRAGSLLNKLRRMGKRLWNRLRG